MKLPWLMRDTPFPPVEQAWRDPDGLLAAGGDLSLDRLHSAYTQGIFPWSSEDEPLLWWSPDPRMVLACAQFAPPHALRKRLRQIARDESQPQSRIEVRVDTAFADVIAACAAPRLPETGTWITPAMQRAYIAWHAQGTAHSIETWIDGQLAGGLYGISLGRMFFGESMFTRVTDASKIALAYLVNFLQRHDVPWLDCQQQTAHLASLGARPVERAAFAAHLRNTVHAAAPPWQPGRLDSRGIIHPMRSHAGIHDDAPHTPV